MSFESELADGFAELANEAGTGAKLSFRGVPLAGVLGGAGGEDPLRVDTKMGSVRRLMLEVARTEIARLVKAPATGDVFVYGDKRLRIEDVEDDDPTTPSVTYTVKLS